MKCVQCPEKAETIARWMTSVGPQEAALCKKCANQLWGKFRHATTFTFAEAK